MCSGLHLHRWRAVSADLCSTAVLLFVKGEELGYVGVAIFSVVIGYS